MGKNGTPSAAPKREKTWQSMSISNDVFERLDVVRERTEKKVGMKLSWTKFFAWILRDPESVREKVEGGR